MAWTGSTPTSRIFIQALLNPITASVWSTTEPTTYGANGLSADSVKAALFNNSVTPDASAAVASTGYNTGTWLLANELIDSGGSNWVAGGVALGTKAYSITGAGSGTTASTLSFGCANITGAGNVTITNAFGMLVYDSTITAGTIAAQGMCFNYFGGAQTVTAGTFTVIPDATGIFKITN